MELISISHLGKNKSITPFISFNQSGSIRLNHAAVKQLNPNVYTDSSIYYLHFYRDKDKFLVSFNTDPKEGVYVRFDGGSKDRTAANNISSSAKNVVWHLAKILDWPLGDGRRNIIRYQVGKEVKPGIFELI